ADTGTSVIGLLLAGGAAGAAGGFIYGENASLTPGQSTFITNTTMMGTMASLNVLTAKDHFDGWADASLAIGMDGGLLAGALIAPHLDWSPRRAGIVFATSFVGSLVGLLVGGLATKPSNGGTADANGTITLALATGGMFAGFGLGAYTTRDMTPDPTLAPPAPAAPTAPAAPPPAAAP